MIVVVLGIVRGAAAHPLAPSLLELVEIETGVHSVLWKTPALRASGVELEPVLPEQCQTRGEAQAERDETAFLVRWVIDCGEEGLVGSVLSVRGLEGSRTSALVRVESLDGRRVQALLRGGGAGFHILPNAPMSQLGLEYTGLGFEHILLGPDHLLFVLGLLLLVRGRRRLILAITAFTLGHSVTLALATFELVWLPSVWIEIGIAVSLVYLAVELARSSDDPATPLQRRPWAASFAFGLFHGLGFASVMREAGLPADEIPFALLCFNVGIELGQLVFVFVTLAVLVGGRIRQRSPWSVDAIGAYAIGSLAVYWILERGEALF